MKKQYMPTKNNQMKLSGTINLSKQGEELLEKKKYILFQYMQQKKEEIEQLQEKAKNLWIEAYSLLQNANVDIGIEEMIKIAQGVEEENSLDIQYTSTMGVELPSIVSKVEQVSVNYGLYGTSVVVDETILKFTQLKQVIIDLAQQQTCFERIKESINPIEKRINALKYRIIPFYEGEKKRIENILEEKEREEFFKSKQIKENLEKIITEK